MSMAKVSTYRAPAVIIEQKTGPLENEGHDSLEKLIMETIGKEQFLSFSRPGESPIQWIQLLNALDPQGHGNRGSQADNANEENYRQQENCDVLSSFASGINRTKEPGNIVKASGLSARMSSSEHVQTLKIPEAVIAFAQAAAKANGEREKYLPGWPLLSPSKVQLQKCGKCSRGFCSPINYRRHIRMHRRSLNFNKVSPKNRELLGAFWDKLSLDEATELASIKDMSLEEVSGSSIMRALASLMRKPGFSSLPQAYLKAGAILLDIVECRPSIFPISSQELFGVLDEASEKTFLCPGTALSLQRFVFDKEVGKIAMEMKNLVACTSFLLEQKLVKAWLANKDAEALRCQQLLFEEEEAAQKRQAELLERKRLKKLRQREHKMKEQLSSLATQNSMVSSEAGLKTTNSSLCSSHLALDNKQPSCMAVEEACNPETGDAVWNLEHQVERESSQTLPTLLHQPVLKPTSNLLGGFHSQVAVIKPMVGLKHNGYKDPKPTSLINSDLVWTRKSKSNSKSECEDVNCKERENKMRDRSDGIESFEVLIGSISVILKDGNSLCENLVSVRHKSVQKKPVKINSTLSSVNQSLAKSCQHVNKQEIEFPGTVKSDNREAGIDESCSRMLPDQSCLADCDMGNCRFEMHGDSVLEASEPSVPELFSSKVAVAFLSQRWREALSSDHVKVQSIDNHSRSMDDTDTGEESHTVLSDVGIYEGLCTEVPVQPSDCAGISNYENQDVGEESIQPTWSTVDEPEFRTKSEKSYGVKFVPKQSLSG